MVELQGFITPEIASKATKNIEKFERITENSGLGADLVSYKRLGVKVSNVPN